MHDSVLPSPPATVAASLRMLLSDIIDYAGSFPPASLPLDTAFENFYRYQESPWSWMLARFVSPAGRLVELSEHVRRTDPPSPYRFSVLTAGGESTERFLSSLESDFRAARHFKQEHGGRVTIDQFEARIPSDLIDTDVVTVRKFLNTVGDALGTTELDTAGFFLELPLDGNIRQTLPVLTGAVRSFNRERNDQETGAFGVKMRTGGAAASDAPTVDQVAHVIISCRDAGIPYKATAGLHHPVRHVDGSGEVLAHGFLNLFLGAVLADVHELDEAAVVRMLSDTDPSSFEFDSEHAAWSNYIVDIPAIERARRRRALSFGSCSFHEPVSELRTLAFL